MSSILQKIKEQNAKPKGKGLFGVVAGGRLAGKTTIAGTLKGKTLLLQAAVLESGSESAQRLAKQLGNSLTVYSFTSLVELKEILGALKDDAEYDSIYVDGLSAITELRAKEPRIAELMKKDNWGAFREIGNEATDVVMKVKELTYPDKAKKAKDAFITCALSIKQDKNGGVVDVNLETVGQMAVTAITKLGECVVTVMNVMGEKGPERKLLTRTVDHWPGRIDGVLDSANPGILPPDLSQVIKLVKGE